MFILYIKAKFTHFSAKIKKHVVFPNRLHLKNNERCCSINQELYKMIYPQSTNLEKSINFLFTHADS